MEKTIFQKIIEKEIPSHKIYEDEDTYAFLSVPAIAEGHTLVITKKPYRNMLDIEESDAVALMKTIKKLVPAVKKATKADGINILQNNESAAGQEVFHIHFHLIPRFDNDKKFHPVDHIHYKDTLRGDEVAKNIQDLI